MRTEKPRPRLIGWFVVIVGLTRSNLLLTSGLRNIFRVCRFSG